MTTTTRIALFLCDTPAPPVVALDGDYRAIFGELMRRALPDPAAAYAIDAFDVRGAMAYPADVGVYDGIMMTGSGASWPLVPRVVACYE